MLLFFLCQMAPAQARLGAEFSLTNLQSFLERGYITRLGWQGWPITLDPHLYLHDKRTLAIIAELEFSVQHHHIDTQILKIYQPLKKLSENSRQELFWFALEASNRFVSEDLMKKLFDQNCQGEWRIPEFTSYPLFVTLYSDRDVTYLRFATHGSVNAPALSQCQ